MLQADRDLRDAIDKLNLLRPDWAVEEKIVFPDEFSRQMHLLGLDKKNQWPWWRILLMSTGGLLILLAIASKVKNYLSRRRTCK